MRNGTVGRTGAYIRHLCSLGIESTIVMPAIVAASRELVGADFGHFMWANESFDVSDVYSECHAAYSTLPAYDRLCRSGNLTRLIGDFSDWMRVRRSFANSSHIDGDLLRSEFYGEVVAPCGGRHFIHVLARHGGRGWGSMILVRAKGSKPFSDEEHRIVDVFSEHLGHVIRRPAGVPENFADASASGVVLVDWDGRVKHWSNGADRLLLEAGDATREYGRAAVFLPPQLHDLICRLRIISGGSPARPAFKTVTNRWGRYLWRAYLVADGTGCVLHCQRQEPVVIQYLTSARACGLSGVQQIVAVKLACGSSYKAIASQTNVKESTVADCVRQIYKRLDVHGIDGLTARLRREHVAPVERR